MNTKDNREFDDFITYERKSVLVIRDEKLVSTLEDEKYNIILLCLRDGPYTLREITKKHNDISSKRKEEITIYRYLKDLIKAGLVIQAGKRVLRGKIATETLYDRVATVYYPVIISEEFWKRPENAIYVEKLSRILELFTNKEKIRRGSVQKLLRKIYSVSESTVSRFLEEKVGEISELFKNDSFSDTDIVLRAFDFIAVLNSYPEMQKELKEILE
ncbi:MAG: hypothetical protein ACTSUR_06195 [Candidatus Heimdallarchaeaceae archaeon]